MNNYYMKRGLIVIFLLLMLPLVSATINIEGPTREEYNVGDQLEVSGYIFLEETFTGFLQTKIICGDNTFPLQITPLNLEAGQQKTFPNDFLLPNMIISSSMANACKINLALIQLGQELETIDSQTFTVTKELSGSFTIPQSTIQIGQQIQMTGSVMKLDGTPIDGSAEIYFEHDEEKYLINVGQIRDGKLNYNYIATAMNPGIYKVSITARDTFGNVQEFKDITSFELIDELHVFSKTDKKELLPGETIKVFGSVTNIQQEALDGINVKVKIGEIEKEGKSENGQYEISLNLPENIKSGKHTVEVTVADDLGNKGTSESIITLLAVESAISLTFSETSLFPEETLIVTPIIYDQSGDIIPKKIVLELENPKGIIVVLKEATSNQQTEIQIPKMGMPGAWKLKANKGTINKEELFNVKELIHINPSITGDVLTLYNDGNVEYKENIEILLDSGLDDYKITNRRNMDVNESVIINLPDEVPSGNYKVTIKLIQGDETFRNIIIANGTAPLNLTWAYAGITLVVIILLYYLISKRKPGKAKRRRNQLKPIQKKPITKKKFSIKNLDKEQSIQDFRERVLQDIKRTEEKAMSPFGNKRATFTPGPTVRPIEQKPIQEKKEEPKNMFALFD